MKKIMLVILVLILIAGCTAKEDSNDLMSIENRANSIARISKVTHFEESDYFTIDVKIPLVDGLSNVEVQNKINGIIERDLMTYLNDMREFVEDVEYEEVYTADELEYIHYQVSSDYEVHTMNDKLLSVTVGLYEYTGGAHGNYWDVAYNFNLETGNEYTLRTYYKDKNYISYVDSVIKSELEREPEDVFEDAFVSFKENGQFFIENERPIVYFNPYEVANYARGIVKIPLGKVMPKKIETEKRDYYHGYDLLDKVMKNNNVNVITKVEIKDRSIEGPIISEDAASITVFLNQLGEMNFAKYTNSELADLYARKEVTHTIELLDNENTAAYVYLLDGNQLILSSEESSLGEYVVYLSEASKYQTEEVVRNCEEEWLSQ